MSLHRVRHGSYTKARKYAELAHGMTDDELVEQMGKYTGKAPGWFLTRSQSRVKRRVYLQEALKRGLISEDPKDLRY